MTSSLPRSQRVMLGTSITVAHSMIRSSPLAPASTRVPRRAGSVRAFATVRRDTAVPPLRRRAGDAGPPFGRLGRTDDVGHPGETVAHQVGPQPVDDVGNRAGIREVGRAYLHHQ